VVQKDCGHLSKNIDAAQLGENVSGFDSQKFQKNSARKIRPQKSSCLSIIPPFFSRPALTFHPIKQP
jgi:hypothetical protein